MIKQLHIMRALAAVSIVMIHVTSGQVLANDITYAANQLSRFASPMFILIAGMVLVYIEMNRPSPSLRYFYKKRFTRVLIPYLLWSVIYYVYVARHLILEFKWGAVGELFMQDFPEDLLRGSAFPHLYFILIMVQLYALFPLLYRWLTVHMRSLVTISLLLTVGLNSLVYAHQFRWIVLPSLPIPYVVIFLNWIAYFVIGMAIMKHEQRWKDKVLKWQVFALTLCVWVGSSALMLIDGKATGTYAISVKPSSMFFALVSFLLIYIVIYSLRYPASPRLRVAAESGVKVTEWLAGSSFLLYLLHPLCMNVLVRGSMYYDVASIFYGVDGLALLFVCTMTLTIIGMIVINRTPFARMLGGAISRRSPRQTQVLIK